MREKFINDTCVLFAKALPDIDLATVRNILALSLEPYEITKPDAFCSYAQPKERGG